MISLSPDRPGAKGSLTFTIRYTGTGAGIPAPVSRSSLRLPAGLSLDIPHLRTCSALRLQAVGPSGCPARSAIGVGRAVVASQFGAQLSLENVTLSAFLGPPRNLQPTFEILGTGYTPIGEQMVLEATATAVRAPYGEELTMSIPPIPTFPDQPDASVLSFSLTIGADGQNQVVVPSRCPAGGLPFAARFSYADGSHGDAFATVPCPRTAARRRRRAA
jgi:hypothetical protein